MKKIFKKISYPFLLTISLIIMLIGIISILSSLGGSSTSEGMRNFGLTFFFFGLPFFIAWVIAVIIKKRIDRKGYLFKKPKSKNNNTSNHSQNKSYSSSTKSGESDYFKKKYEEEQRVKTQKDKKIWDFDKYIKNNYINLPLPEFKLHKQINLDSKICTGLLSSSDLDDVVKQMIKHLKQTFNYASIEVKLKNDNENSNKAGQVDNIMHKIQIYYSKDMKTINILAILAHEISHVYQYYEKIQYSDKVEDVEKFTDALTFYLGFGDFTLKGKRYYVLNGYKTLGYLNDEELKTAQLIYKGRVEIKDILREETDLINIVKKKINTSVQVLKSYREQVNLLFSQLQKKNKINKTDFESISRISQEIYLHKNIDIEGHLSSLKNFTEKKDYEDLLKVFDLEIQWWMNIYLGLEKVKNSIDKSDVSYI